MADERQGMSEREYAQHAGISRQAVAKARASGRLVLHDDGSIDAAASDQWRQESTDAAKQRSEAEQRPVPEEATSALMQTLRDQGIATRGSNVTFMDAKTANEVMKAQDRRLNLLKKKGELVDKARATTLVFRLARAERDAWLGWPTRVAAQMAAELGVPTHQMQQTLERYVEDHLRRLPEIRPEFR